VHPRNLKVPQTKRQIEIRSFRAAVERVKIIPAMLGDDAGILGAARLGFIEKKSFATASIMRTL
jgi:hypothetical protein